MPASDFYALMFRRAWPSFVAFDVLRLDGEDLTACPLLERKRRLRAIMPHVEWRLLYLDHVAGRGVELFASGWDRELEGSSRSGRRVPTSRTA